MLCKACSELFSFSAPFVIQQILEIKRTAIEVALEAFGDVPKVQVLKEDLLRYERLLKSRVESESLCPCPWSTQERVKMNMYPDSDCLFSWRNPDLPQSQNGIKGRRWEDLKNSAASVGCSICRAIVAMLSQRLIIELHEADHLDVYWNISLADTVPKSLHFRLYRGTNSLCSITFETCVNHITDVKTRSQLHMPSGKLSNDESCLEFLAISLKRCLQEHNTCFSSRSLDDVHWIPTRLIDVLHGSNSHNTIRLVEQVETVASPNKSVQYLTLSHMWGEKKSFKLTDKNYQDMRNGIEMSLLPQCFQDAVFVSRRLGIRYLWIDSLCIIQNSPKDWETESVTMDKVYQRSTLTIAACNSTDSFCSLFVERDPCAGAAMVFQQQFSDQEVEFTVLPNWPEFTRDYAPLYRRGWVVQEKYLSSRIIHFTRFPFWECGATVTTEAYPDRTGSNNLGFTSLPSTERDWISTVKTSENPDWNWNKVLSQYTGCSLTHDNDILVAISGIAKCFSDVIKEDYFAGIWGGKYVISSLLWRKVLTRMSNQPKVHSATSYRAPSWSWASVDGRTIGTHSSMITEPLAHLLSIQTIPINSFGRVQSGELILKGSLFERIWPWLTKPSSESESFDSFDCKTDQLFPQSSTTYLVYFLPLAKAIGQGRWEAIEIITGIYLRIMPDNGMSTKRVFRRIGYAEFTELEESKTEYDKARNIEWKRLTQTSSPNKYSEEVLII